MNNATEKKEVGCNDLVRLEFSGLMPTPITDSFEKWWSEHGVKCETLAKEIGIKGAVERGFFGCYESSTSTFVRLNPASTIHSAGGL